MSDHRHRCVLRPRRERPRCSRAAKQRDELASVQSVESHSIPASQDQVVRISNWPGSVRG